MKTIVRVARTELRTLFYSPIAWFLMIVFLIQCGIAYLSVLQGYARRQALGGEELKYIRDLTNNIYLGPGALFGTVIDNLYLYIPLLTMGLISRETSSGTIKLLYSSPIKVREIVLGKFMAMMGYSLILVAIASIFIVSGLFQVKSPDTGMLMTAALGFYLLLCAYSAIGLFMSCLTTYQIVAAISTFVMIGVLRYIGNLWQGIDFVRELTYFLSISGRTEHMLLGLLVTKDVIYFLLIVYIFLGLSIYKLKAGMESKPPIIKAARYIGVVATALLIGYISSIPQLIGYYDATADKMRTLTPNAQKIIRELGDEPLEVTAYNNMLGGFWHLGSPESYNQNHARWEPYIRFKHNIVLKTVNYYDSTLDMPYLMNYPGKTIKAMAEHKANVFNINLKRIKTPEEIRKIIDLRPELNRYVMQLKYKGRTTFLRIFDDGFVWPSETEVSAAFKRLLQARLPKIAFLSGDLERDINKAGDRDYKTLTNLSTFRYSLVNQGFDVDTVSLEDQDLPADISTLVIADPKIDLDTAALQRIRQYIDKGGNLVIAGEPGKQAILNPLLKQMGVQMMDGMIIQESKEMAPNLVTLNITDFAASFSKLLALRKRDSVRVSMPGVAGLTYDSSGVFKVRPLLLSDARLTWNRKQKLDMETMTSATMAPISAATRNVSSTAAANNRFNKLNAGTVHFSAADGDEKGPIPTVVALTRSINGKEQRIIIAGDADFMSNSELGRANLRIANFVFNTALFSWLCNGEFPIDTSRPESKDNRVRVSSDDVDMLRIIYVWVFPGILLAFGTILLLRRKRK